MAIVNTTCPWCGHKNKHLIFKSISWENYDKLNCCCWACWKHFYLLFKDYKLIRKVKLLKGTEIILRPKTQGSP